MPHFLPKNVMVSQNRQFWQTVYLWKFFYFNQTDFVCNSINLSVDYSEIRYESSLDVKDMTHILGITWEFVMSARIIVVIVYLVFVYVLVEN